MKTFLAILDDEQYDNLKVKSQLYGVSMSDLVRQTLSMLDNVGIVFKNPIKIGKFSTVEWSDRVKERDNYICAKCGLKGERNTTVAHHILPKKKGGKNALSNGMTLCRSCHKNIHNH